MGKVITGSIAEHVEKLEHRCMHINNKHTHMHLVYCILIVFVCKWFLYGAVSVNNHPEISLSLAEALDT